MGNMWGDETNKDKIGHMDKNLIMKPVVFYAILNNYLLILAPPLLILRQYLMWFRLGL